MLGRGLRSTISARARPGAAVQCINLKTGVDEATGPHRRLEAVVMDETPRCGARWRHDAAAVRVLTREAYAKWVPVIGREPLPMRADHDEAVRQHRIDLAFLDGGLAGLIETIRTRAIVW